VVKGDGL